MIALGEEYHAGQYLTLLFSVDEPEQAEAQHDFRAVFGEQSDIEAVNESLYALHIRPGHPNCPCDGDKRAKRS